MRKNLLIKWVPLLLLISSMAWAQERTITGRVTSADDGSTLPGVNVIIKGTTSGTVTDSDGKYSIAVPTSGGSLIFSFIGLKTFEIAVGDRTVVDIQLGLDVTQLSEIVVVGYGTQSKRELTGSIASVGGKEISSLPVQSFDQALQGRAAGVQITTPNGVLNNPPVIRIRGVNSINLSSFPLVVIDGIPTFTGNNSANNETPNNPLSNINPADIESVEVLKDASAGAIYGSRAAAGVILITTKKGAKGRSKVTLDSWAGLTEATNLIDVLNADQYVSLKNEGVRNLNANVLAATGTPGTNVEGFQPSVDASGRPIDTDWYKSVYQTGFSYSNTLSFSGATEKTNYYLSVGNTKQEGLLKTNTFERTSIRVNLDHKVIDKLTVGLNAGFTNGFNGGAVTGSTPGSAFATSGLGRLPLVLPPITAPFEVDGSYSVNRVFNADGTPAAAGGGIGSWAILNPNTGTRLNMNFPNPDLLLAFNTFTSESSQLQGSVYANIEIIKGLNFRTTYGVDNTSFEDLSYANPRGGDGWLTIGSASNIYRTNKRWNWQNTLQFDRKFLDNHSFSLLLGAEEQGTKIERWGANRTTQTDLFFTSFQGNFTNIVPSGNVQTENYLVSYFGRLNYDYKKKYFLSANLRRDGYSAWANKYGDFYGLSAGYAITEEDFWKNNSFLSSINFLKIKASYGEVGNSNGIADFASLQTYNSGLYANVGTLFYAQAGNSLLTWETSKKTDVGITFGILQDRIQGEVSYYSNLIDGLILDVQQAPSKGIPFNPTITNVGTISTNVGAMVNSGIELSLKFNAVRTTDFSWTVSGNYTTLSNEVTKLAAEGERIGSATSGLETANFTTVGKSAGSILAVVAQGVNPLNGRRVIRKADGTLVQYSHLSGGTGWTFVDTGLAVPSTEVPTQLADGQYFNALPTWYGGFDNTFSYKNFDLGVFLQFSGGNYIYNGTKAGLRDQRFWNNHTDVLNRWTPENTSGSIPRLVYADNVSNGSALVMSENVEKGDFLRLRNVSLGYSLPASVLKRVKLNTARFYVQAQNLFTVTNYTGFDPEVASNGNNNTASSVDRNSVGQAKTYTVGVNLSF
jgi:TonB-linked SusC/RagA family outer membrane protein